ncbi:CsbD family protein [Streptomyces sp. H27-D2]|uniref:CsbD family protein n=1 Tax=Streptomyces sp. H27-D2 TaxID=3046304 RepID=UPI002DBCAB88|nr:CsbD family protein [Streptomyces sp. H27-D2]MEC4020832.1 CsbD family protein [Streptomyces sp. H27-D2]
MTEDSKPGESAMDKMRGMAKEMAGKASGNDRMKAEGKTDQAKGKAKEAAEDAKETMGGVKDSMTDDDKH